MNNFSQSECPGLMSVLGCREEADIALRPEHTQSLMKLTCVEDAEILEYFCTGLNGYVG